MALAEMVGHEGRVYAVDSDPLARDEVARTAAAYAQVIALTQAGEDLILPEQVDLAFCRFLLLHVHDPAVVVRRMAAVVKPGVVGGGPGADHLGRSHRRGPDVDARRPPPRHRRPAPRAGARRRARGRRRLGRGAGGGRTRARWRDYLESLTGVDPGDDPVVLPPLVTVVGRARDGRR